MIMEDSLLRIRGIDNDGVLGLVVNNEVGVVVTTSRPCSIR